MYVYCLFTVILIRYSYESHIYLFIEPCKLSSTVITVEFLARLPCASKSSSSLSSKSLECLTPLLLPLLLHIFASFDYKSISTSLLVDAFLYILSTVIKSLYLLVSLREYPLTFSFRFWSFVYFCLASFRNTFLFIDVIN